MKVLSSQLEVPASLHNSLFTVGYDTGVFTMINFAFSYRNYLIYVEAYNSKLWGGANETYLIDSSLTSEYAIPNMPPFFDSDIQNISLDLSLAAYPNGTVEVSDDRQLAYPLPDTFDATNDSVTLTIENQPDVPFVQLSNGSIIVDSSLLGVEDVGTHQIMLLLTDSQGGSREYSLYITITAGDIEQKVFE